jgi:RimJ/RimL family protein N-acetyltransferase
VITELNDIEVLAGFFRADPFLHLYALGDLDDFFRPHARWWGWTGAADVGAGGPGCELREVILLYDPGTLPVLLAFTRDAGRMAELLVEMSDRLPARFYAHLSPGVEVALADGFHLESHGRHLRMGLIDASRLPAEGTPPGESRGAGNGLWLRTAGDATLSALSRVDLTEVLDLFAASYQGNWFDPRMLDTGQYLGARIDGRLCAVAGVHVYSEAYGVAALGNIATRPEHRGKGLAGFVTGALCRQLRRGVDWIGLNVHAENAAAIACYRRLGFARVADYGEFMVESS